MHRGDLGERRRAVPAINRQCKRTADPDVFAAGDVASVWQERYGRGVRVEHWAAATNGGSWAGDARDALSAFGDLDVVIANAGIGVMGSVEELSIDDYRRQFETNVFGVLRTVKASLGSLKRTSGRIGVVGSVSGFLSLPQTSAYAMSKFAVRALAEALGAELANDGVSVTHIAPGFVESELRKVDNSGNFQEHRRDPIPPFLVMSNERAAHEMADAVQGRRPEVVVTNHGKAAMFVATRFPRTVHSVVRLASAQITARVKAQS